MPNAYVRFEQPRWLTTAVCGQQERIVLFQDESAVRVVPEGLFRVPSEFTRIREGWNRLAYVAIGPFQANLSTQGGFDDLLRTVDKLHLAAEIAVAFAVRDNDDAVIKFAQAPERELAALRLAVMKALQAALATQSWSEIERIVLANAVATQANDSLSVLRVTSLVVSGLRAKSPVIDAAAQRAIEATILAQQAVQRREEDLAEVRSATERERLVASARRDAQRDDMNVLLDAIQRPGGEVLLAPEHAAERLRLEAEVTKFMAAEKERWFNSMMHAVEVTVGEMGSQREAQVLREVLKVFRKASVDVSFNSKQPAE